MAVKKKYNSFAEILSDTEATLLVDFYAPWCGPCQMMASILEEVNHHLKNQLKIVKINTDKYPELASKYAIEALPTMIIFKDGQQVDRIQGVMQTEPLIKHLQRFI